MITKDQNKFDLIEWWLATIKPTSHKLFFSNYSNNFSRFLSRISSGYCISINTENQTCFCVTKWFVLVYLTHKINGFHFMVQRTLRQIIPFICSVYWESLSGLSCLNDSTQIILKMILSISICLIEQTSELWQNAVGCVKSTLCW